MSFQVNLPILKKFTKDDNIIPISAKFGLNITSFLVHIRKVYDSLLNKQPDDNVGIVK